MSKHKTLKQKKLAKLKLAKTSNYRSSQIPETGINYQELKIKKEDRKEQNIAYILNGQKVAKPIDEDSLLAVNPSFIRKDLIKTFVLSLIFIGGIFILNWAMQSGKINF